MENLKPAGEYEYVLKDDGTWLRIKKMAQPNDPVNHPSHYTDGNIEVIDFIFDKGLGRDFCLGNAIKYISRAGKKDPSKEKEDLMKARWYLDRYIQELEKTHD